MRDGRESTQFLIRDSLILKNLRAVMGSFIPADSRVSQGQNFTILLMAKVESHYLGTQVFYRIPTFG